MKKVLVAGATGYIGKFVVREFKQRGYWVRALARRPEKLESRGPFLEPAVSDLIDDIFVGEVTVPESLSGVCEDIDIVFSSIGITRQKDKAGFMDIDYQGNKNLLNLAVNQNPAKFIFVSVYQADMIKNLAVAREMFAADLKNSGLDYAIIRPTGYYSDMSEFLNMAHSGRVYLLGDGRSKINPVHGADLARVCVDAVEKQDKEIPVGGPETFTYDQIARLAFSVLGKAPRITHIPLWPVRALTRMIRPFSARYYTIASFFTAVMKNDFDAPKTGTHRLEAYFREYATSGNGGI
jgi:uncharacterized protein YbjT (DUF2867 family)